MILTQEQVLDIEQRSYAIRKTLVKDFGIAFMSAHVNIKPQSLLGIPPHSRDLAEGHGDIGKILPQLLPGTLGNTFFKNGLVLEHYGVTILSVHDNMTSKSPSLH